MASKKSFRTPNISEQFLSQTAEPEATAEDKPTKRIPKAVKKEAPVPEVIQPESKPLKVLANHHKGEPLGRTEAKTKRLQILIQPSVYNRIKEQSLDHGISVNDYISRLLVHGLQDDLAIGEEIQKERDFQEVLSGRAELDKSEALAMAQAIINGYLRGGAKIAPRPEWFNFLDKVRTDYLSQSIEGKKYDAFLLAAAEDFLSKFKPY